MSNNTEGSTPDISEEPNEGNTQEITEEKNESNTQEIGEDDSAVKKLTATEEHSKELFNQLKEGGVSRIILTGVAGTGKTWMAEKISEFAVKEKHDEPIWISLDKKHHDKDSIYDTIARQFSLATSADAREEDGENEKKGKNVKSLKEKMREKLEAASKEKFLLMVLDGQLEMRTEEDKKEQEIENWIMEMLGLEDCTGVDYKDKFKVLITRRNSEDVDGSKRFELVPLSGDDAVMLLEKNVADRVRYCDSQSFKNLSGAIQQKIKVLPAEILILAGNLNYIAKDNSGDWDLKRAFEAATNDLEQLLRYTYDKEPGNCMINCFWHSWNFLRRHGGVYYNELITNWIMEGVLNPYNQIDKAYEDGHNVLMKLIDCHMLKMQEDNVIVLEGLTVNMNEYCRRGYSGTTDPGSSSVLKDYNWSVFEGIAPADGMMKTVCGDKKEKMITSLLINGSRLCREIHNSFFGSKQNLRLLSIFQPRLKSPEELSISKMKELLVLMLRGSYLLKDVNHIIKLKALTVLEVSGANFLKEIPPEFFDEVSQLRSFDLSGSGIEELPLSFSKLTKLRRLILRQCSSLRELPKLEKFSELEVIDLSESTNFKKIQEKSFKSLEKLQVINFSKTKIEKLPIVKSLRNLTILLLQGCCQLSGMRRVKQVSSLKMLDLSGSTNIKEIMYDCFEQTEALRELDLSETKIQYLPDIGGNLQKLRLRGCSLLRNLPELGGHSRLEELELSGCERLVNLPDLTAFEKLKILGLENCTNLDSLPYLKSLSKLEELNLRGTELWSEGLEVSLSHITRLRILK